MKSSHEFITHEVNKILDMQLDEKNHIMQHRQVPRQNERETNYFRLNPEFITCLHTDELSNQSPEYWNPYEPVRDCVAFTQEIAKRFLRRKIIDSTSVNFVINDVYKWLNEDENIQPFLSYVIEKPRVLIHEYTSSTTFTMHTEIILEGYFSGKELTAYLLMCPNHDKMD